MRYILVSGGVISGTLSRYQDYLAAANIIPGVGKGIIASSTGLVRLHDLPDLWS